MPFSTCCLCTQKQLVFSTRVLIIVYLVATVLDIVSPAGIAGTLAGTFRLLLMLCVLRLVVVLKERFPYRHAVVGVGVILVLLDVLSIILLTVDPKAMRVLRLTKVLGVVYVVLVIVATNKLEPCCDGAQEGDATDADERYYVLLPCAAADRAAHPATELT